MWHMTGDTWQVTRDTWCGVNILSKFQFSSSNNLGLMMFWRSGGKGWMSDSVNYEAVCRTAPATPGLLIIYFDWQHFRNLLSNSFEGFRNYWRYVRNDSYLEEFSVEVIFQEQIEKRFLCQRKLEKRLFVGAGGQYCLLKYFLFIFVLTLKKYFLDNRIKIFIFF